VLNFELRLGVSQMGVQSIANSECKLDESAHDLHPQNEREK